MRRDEFRHLKHRYLALTTEYHLQFVIGQNIALVGWILEIVLLDVVPEALHHLSASHRPLAYDCLKLGGKVHRF